MTDNHPSITVLGVPETITRGQYTALIQSVGFDANNLVSLRFASDGIYAQVIVRDEEGNRVIDHSPPGRPRGAVHEVYVRVVDAEETGQ